jgi:hypothetical protein
MTGHVGRTLRPWLGALGALVVALALGSCTTARPPAPTSSAGQGSGHKTQAAKSPLSAQQVIDKLGLKWKYTDPPVVVFHNPG